MICFLLGLSFVWIAIDSPLDALGQFLLVAHMTQHFLLMSIVPPLLLLGAPTVPMLRGLPRAVVREIFPVWINRWPLHGFLRFIAHPLFGWMAMNLSYVIWHVPSMYELALRSNNWHYVEHGCFFFGSLAFWWTVIQPWPSKGVWSRWLIIPYLVTADIVNTGISASLAFVGRVTYPTYATVPRIFSISALEDQVAAGAEMWVLTSLVSLIPLMLTVSALLSSQRKQRRSSAKIRGASSTPQSSTAHNKLSWITRVLRLRYTRVLLQTMSFLVLLAVIAHGLLGTQLSAMSLAGGFVWMIARPILFLAMLVLGNLFCMACPFTLPREIARRLHLPKYQWPSWLRNKWSATALAVLFFWSYLHFDLWNWPNATAWILLAYTLSSLLVDSFFQGASFCKYLCPIGQFNFAATTTAALELKIIQPSTCSSCSSHDCIRGNATQRGCEMNLFLPQKIGNQDCTFCMDCVKACPHENVQIARNTPIADMFGDARRSSIGVLSSRVDLACILLLFLWSALANAAAMTAPVMQFIAQISSAHAALANSSVSLLLVLFVALIAGSLHALLALVAKVIAPVKEMRVYFCKLAWASIPLGISLWSAHLLFHLSTSLTALPAILGQGLSEILDVFHLGHGPLLSVTAPITSMCEPMSLMLTAGSGGTSVLSVQLWMLDIGLLYTLYLCWKMIVAIVQQPSRRAALMSLWGSVALLCYVAGVWIFHQPMQMIGMGMR